MLLVVLTYSMQHAQNYCDSGKAFKLFLSLQKNYNHGLPLGSCKCELYVVQSGMFCLIWIYLLSIFSSISIISVNAYFFLHAWWMGTVFLVWCKIYAEYSEPIRCLPCSSCISFWASNLPRTLRRDPKAASPTFLSSIFCIALGSSFGNVYCIINYWEPSKS